jgi:hypothetical protein
MSSGNYKIPKLLLCRLLKAVIITLGDQLSLMQTPERKLLMFVEKL